MENEIKKDSIESQNENESTNVDNEKNEEGRSSWLWKPIGCLFEFIGIILVLLIVGNVRTCVRSSLSPETTEEQMQSVVEEIKDDLPQKVDDVTKLVDVKFTDEALIYEYEIDDRNFDIRSADRAMMKSNLLAGWKHDDNLKKFAQTCAWTNRSVMFKYRSATTGYTIIITFTLSELKSLYNNCLKLKKVDSQTRVNNVHLSNREEA